MKEQFESTLPRGRWLCAGVALICTIAFKGAIACSFGGLEREVQFPPTSTRLRSEQVISLTNWFIEQKDTRRATHGIYRANILAFAIKGDADSSRKAHLRLAKIAGLLKTLSDGTSFEVEPMSMNSKARRQDGWSAWTACKPRFNQLAPRHAHAASRLKAQRHRPSSSKPMYVEDLGST